MIRLLRDRYFVYHPDRARDLATGEEILLSDLPDPNLPGDEPADVASGSGRSVVNQGLAVLIEVLEQGRDGDPRWVVADARNGGQAAAMARRAAAAARRRGFIAVSVDQYRRLGDVLDGELRDRALLLIGGFGSAVAAGREALVGAAAISPRPHVLLTFRTSSAVGAASIVKEARSAYGVQPASLPPRAGVHRDLTRHLERVTRAKAFVREGRHAAAERLLREVAGALERRAAFTEAAGAMTTLGRLLLERGRAPAAEAAFRDAARLAENGGDATTAADSRTWQAWARMDSWRLSDAESLVRAVLLTTMGSEAAHAWAHAALARCLLWQERPAEAAALPLGPVRPGSAGATGSIDPVVAAASDAIAVRVLLSAGRCFEAGQRARQAVDRAPVADALACAIGHTAHLRVLCASGDLVLAAESVGRIATLARRAHAPLRLARARLIWFETLRRAGRSGEQEREAACLRRIGRLAPPLLRRAIDAAMAPGDQGRGIMRVPVPMSLSVSAASLVRLVQDEDDDMAAVRRAAERIAAEWRTSRIDLISAAAGPPTAILTVGHGLPTSLGSRVLECGLALGCDDGVSAGEAGMPVRLGSQLLGALVCRWPIDRGAPPQVREMLEVVTAIIAPRVDGLLTRAREAAHASTSSPELVSVSDAMNEVRQAMARAARAPFSVLIEGESGVGKELVARAIHQLGPRRERRFCDVNCAALPEELLESELFGHARGAFTGAVADRAGLFEEADGGTLFLDEVIDLSARAQAKLLRVVQQQEVRRVGETFSRAIDVRLVAAANRDVGAEAQAGRFRQDLLYRLDVIRIRIPPLRERPEDVAVLAAGFWRAAAARVGSTATLAPGTLAELSRYHWPGNVRELQNVIAALAVAAPPRGRVRSSLLPSAISTATTVSSARLAEARAQFERRFVETALARAGGSRTHAAAALGLSRQGLLKTMARLAMHRAKPDHAR